jgi:hypothetical protein
MSEEEQGIVEVRQYFLRELKEQDLIHCVWTTGTTMSSDVLTKNLPQDIFERHTKVKTNI